jgi:hypothetical protein
MQALSDGDGTDPVLHIVGSLHEPLVAVFHESLHVVVAAVGAARTNAAPTTANSTRILARDPRAGPIDGMVLSPR